MQLLEEDEAFLRSKGYDWELVPEDNGLCVIFKQYRLAPGKYDHDIVDLLVQIPSGYNNAKLDMFYVDPPVRLKATGQYPQAADAMFDHVSRKWQRFSRHLPQWRAGRDTLQNFMPIVNRELQDSP